MEEDARLSRRLRGWKVDAALPPRFQEQVWQRIARDEARVKPGGWTALGRWMESVFTRPSLAISYVAVLMGVGVSAGYWRAEVTTARAVNGWRTQYVQSIDPYYQAQRMSHP